MISSPKVDDAAWNNHCNKMGFIQVHNDHLSAVHAKECVAFSKENNLACIDLNSIMMEFGEDYKSLLYDGLHLSKSGSKVLFDALKPVLEENITNDLKLMYPTFQDIENNNAPLKQ